MRSLHNGIGLLLIVLLLAGCGQTAAAQHKLVGTSRATAPSQACSGLTSAERIGDLVVAAQFALTFPSRQLPAGLPLQPLQIPNPDDSTALNAQLPVLPQVNPQLGGASGGFLVTVCNASASSAHRIQGGTVRIATLAPFAGRVEAWNPCDGFFTRSVSSGVTGVGCGGAISADELLHVTFPEDAGAGFETPAVSVGATNPSGEFGPLPVTLSPGKQIKLHITATNPSTPGTYTFAFALTADDTQLAFVPLGQAALFAPVAHKWTGAACLASQMQRHIPAETTPSTFFICPEGVVVVPTEVPGKG